MQIYLDMSSRAGITGDALRDWNERSGRFQSGNIFKINESDREMDATL
jgi:hypothetical protein